MDTQSQSHDALSQSRTVTDASSVTHCVTHDVRSVCHRVNAHSETGVKQTQTTHSIVTAAQCATVVLYSVWHSVNVTVTCLCVYTRSGTVTENLHRGDGRRSV